MAAESAKARGTKSWRAVARSCSRTATNAIVVTRMPTTTGESGVLNASAGQSMNTAKL